MDVCLAQQREQQALAAAEVEESAALRQPAAQEREVDRVAAQLGAREVPRISPASRIPPGCRVDERVQAPQAPRSERTRPGTYRPRVISFHATMRTMRAVSTALR